MLMTADPEELQPLRGGAAHGLHPLLPAGAVRLHSQPSSHPVRNQHLHHRHWPCRPGGTGPEAGKEPSRPSPHSLSTLTRCIDPVT